MLYLAAFLIVLGVALFVAAPLFESDGSREVRAGGEMARIEHERALAIQGLRELEFDRQMHKVAEEDYATLHAVLEARALTAMASLDQMAARPTVPPKRIAAAAPAASRQPWGFCPSCGSKLTPEARFCAECGAPVALREAGMMR